MKNAYRFVAEQAIRLGRDKNTAALTLVTFAFRIREIGPKAEEYFLEALSGDKQMADHGQHWLLEIARIKDSEEE